MKNHVKNFATAAALAVITAVTASPALAAPSNLDQYGCKVESSQYRCYEGANNGRAFKNQQDMLQQANQPAGGNANTNRRSSTDSNIGTSNATAPTNGNGSMRSNNAGSSSTTPTGNTTNGGVRY
jgi:hypothetical protein